MVDETKDSVPTKFFVANIIALLQASDVATIPRIIHERNISGQRKLFMRMIRYLTLSSPFIDPLRCRYQSEGGEERGGGMRGKKFSEIME